MKRIIYCSQATDDVTPDELIALLELARLKNERVGLTGMLLYCSQSFLQVLEGEPEALETVYAIISADPRHTNLRLLMDAEIPARLFPDWTMGFEHVDDEDLVEDLKGFKPATEYPLVNPDLITNAVVAQTLLTLYAKNRAVSAGPQAAENAGMTGSRAAEVDLFSLAGHDGILRGVNEAFARLLGLSPVEINGRSLLELVHPEDTPAIAAGLSALGGGTAEVPFENRFILRDGGTVHLQWVARPLPGTELWWASGRDTTEFHRLLSQVLKLRARLELVVGQGTAAMWDLDVRRGRFTWEARSAEILGIGAAALPETVAELAALVHAEDSAPLLAALQQLVEAGAFAVGVRVGRGAAVRHLSLRGKILDRDHRDRPLRAVGLALDITAEKAMEEKMLRMVMSDALTSIPNRRAFDQALRTEARRCSRELEPLSVVMVDIDNFKAFNDTFGHLIGDTALVAVARALTEIIQRAGDVLARFGGEEFAVVLPGVDDRGAFAVAERVVAAVRSVTVRQAPGWDLSVSVGSASWHPGEAKLRPVELLTQADQALYAAKAAGKDRAVAHRNA